MLANCGHDERGKYTGGKAGDQSGTEWYVRSWYRYPYGGGWKVVLRHPNANVRAVLAGLAVEAAENNKIGYDQGQRTTFGTELKRVGYRPKNIKTACETDCSKGTIDLIRAVGQLLGFSKLKKLDATYTGNLRAGCKNAGFEILTASKYLTSEKYLVPGDIVLNDNWHVAIIIGKSAADAKKAANRILEADKAEKDEYAGVYNVPITTNAVAAAQEFNKTYAGTYKVTATALNLRAVPGARADHPVLTVLEKGDKVTCYGYLTKVDKVPWLYVTHKGYTGYCSTTYLKKV